VTPHHFAEPTSQTLTGPPPPPDPIQSKDNRTAELMRIEVLMCDCIAPLIQLFEEIHQRRRPRIISPHFIPEMDPQPAEIRAEAARLSIAAVQLTIPDEFVPHHGPDCERRRNHPDKMIDALRMKVSTEPLKLRGEHHGVGPIELLGIEPPATLRPTHRGVTPRDLVEGLRPRCSPFSV
jgi:hypothetical protein